MKMDIILISHNRKMMTVRSILGHSTAISNALNHELLNEVGLYIWVDSQDELEFFTGLYGDTPWIHPQLVKDYGENAPLRLSQFMIESKADLMHLTFDDHNVWEDCYVNSVRAMIKYFPQINGVVSMYIVNYSGNYPWQSREEPLLVSSKLIKAFYNKHAQPVFCPDYKRRAFECEFGAYIRHGNMVWNCKDAKVDHWWEAKTHTENINHGFNYDMRMQAERIKRGYHWGLDFNLVGTL